MVRSDRESCEDLPPYEVPPAWLVTPRSYLLDRYTPMCERVYLPKMTVRGGRLVFRKCPEVEFPGPASGRLGHFKKKFLPERRRHEDGALIDLRGHAPGNWAHFLTNHLPLTFKLADTTETRPSQLKIILPERTPGHILAVAEMFSLEVVCTDDTVEGSGIAFSVSPWHGMRSVRHNWIRTPWVQDRLTVEMGRARRERSLPERVFIARRDTRRLQNEDAISDFLDAFGFTKIYIEDWPVVDQFRIFNEAEKIVGIHGAGFAPLLYRGGQARPLSIIELFPPGHVTFVWRVLAYQAMATDWTGVRGHLRPEHLRDAYDLGRPFLRDSLQDFTVDVASVELALEMSARSHCEGDMHV